MPLWTSCSNLDIINPQLLKLQMWYDLAGHVEMQAVRLEFPSAIHTDAAVINVDRERDVNPSCNRLA